MFAKKQRIPRDLVKKIMLEGEKGSSSLFYYKKMINSLDYPRFAVIVSKKVQKGAVGRHFIKRRFVSVIKELLQNGHLFGGSDIVFMVLKPINHVDYSQIKEEIKKFSF